MSGIKVSIDYSYNDNLNVKNDNSYTTDFYNQNNNDFKKSE